MTVAVQLLRVREGLFIAEHCAKVLYKVEMMKSRQPRLPGESDSGIRPMDHGCDTRELGRHRQEDQSETRIVKKMAFIKDTGKGVKHV